jgi:hypothetical protein
MSDSNMLEARVEHADHICTVCGRPEESFACKIRHLQLNTGAAKAARD